MATLTFGLILVCLYLGYKVLSLAKKYNVGKTTILDIKNGLKYAK